MKCPRCNGAELTSQGKDYYCHICNISFESSVILNMKINQMEYRIRKLEEDVVDLKLN